MTHKEDLLVAELFNECIHIYIPGLLLFFPFWGWIIGCPFLLLHLLNREPPEDAIRSPFRQAIKVLID